MYFHTLLSVRLLKAQGHIWESARTGVGVIIALIHSVLCGSWPCDLRLGMFYMWTHKQIVSSIRGN